MPKLPKVKAGDTLKDIRASDFNLIAERIEDLSSRLLGLERWVKGPQGGDDRQFTQVKTVVIVKKPEDDDSNLTVKAVRYDNAPPKACDAQTCHIVYIEPEFKAFPDFGQKISDYKDVWQSVDDPLDSSTRFFLIRRIDNQWVILNPHSNEPRAAKINADSLLSSTDVFKVQPVKRDTSNDLPPGQSGPPVPTTFINDGAEIMVRAWPGFDPVKNFTDIAKASRTMYIEIQFMQGQWWAMQTLRVGTHQFDASLPQGAC